MALFHHWNRNRFSKVISIRREDIMQAARITSVTSYYSCLKDLQQNGLLHFHKSPSRFNQATLEMIPLGNYKSSPGNVQIPPEVHMPAENRVPPEVPFIKTNLKKNKNSVLNRTPTQEEILFFFHANNQSTEEAMKFFFFNEATNWTIGDIKVTNWQALAQKWMIRQTPTKQQQNAPKIPNYNEPL
jgi:hypothetical protein